MAERLLSVGYPLTVWNRTPDKAAALGRRGAYIATTPADVARRADVLMLMLSDGPAVSDMLFRHGVVDALGSGRIVVDMSSIAPSYARRHAGELAQRGVEYLDAPVSGGTKGAAEGTLAIMVGGDPDAFERARPIFEQLGRPTLVGESGLGQVAKLANQIIVAITIGAVAEALLLVGAAGGELAKVRAALSGGFADSPILKLHGQRMLERSWTPGGTLQNQLKDLRSALGMASDLKLQLPVSERILELFETAVAAGLGSFDHSALFLELERRNQTPHPSDGSDVLSPGG
jgi:2-hydroxy-3-oxopropionate reductase